MKNNKPMLYKKHFNKFVKALNTKMEKGYQEYSDDSFNLPAENVIQEMIEETEDIAGWGLILWVRLQKMKEKLNEKQ